MGRKIRITKFTKSAADSEQSTREIHGVGDVCGDPSTACGMPLIDEAEEYAETKRAITCRACISVIEAREPYKMRKNGKWY